jgi:hypothetical protein
VHDRLRPRYGATSLPVTAMGDPGTDLLTGTGACMRWRLCETRAARGLTVTAFLGCCVACSLSTERCADE